MRSVLSSVTVRRRITAGRPRVFDAFSRADALVHWFTPSPEITVEVLAFDFRPGGAFRLRYTMPDGSRPVVVGTYELISPPQQLTFTWLWEPPDPHADIPTRVRVTFLERGQATEVVIVHEQLPSDETCRRHLEGWRDTLDQLAVRFDSLDLPSRTETHQPEEPRDETGT